MLLHQREGKSGVPSKPLSLDPVLWRPVSAENTLHSLRPPLHFYLSPSLSRQPPSNRLPLTLLQCFVTSPQPHSLLTSAPAGSSRRTGGTGEEKEEKEEEEEEEEKVPGWSWSWWWWRVPHSAAHAILRIRIHSQCSDDPYNTTLPPYSWIDCCRSNTKKDKSPIRFKHKCWNHIARCSSTQ